MKRASFDKGVLAAARVACALAIVGVGCAGENKETETDTVLSASDTDTESVDPLADCETQVAELFADTGAVASEEDEDCCQLIAEYYDSVELEGLEDWAERDDCCEALDWEGSLACTPWGPPCPPSMGVA